MVEIHGLKCVHMKYTVYEDDDTNKCSMEAMQVFVFSFSPLKHKKDGSSGCNAWVNPKIKLFLEWVKVNI